MKIQTLIFALSTVCLWNTIGVAQERTAAASGLWRSEHARKTTYFCLDHNFQPWRMLRAVTSGPPVGEGSFREPKGNLVRYVVRLERRDWVDGGVYISESSDTVRYIGSPPGGDHGSLGAGSVVRRSWQGDFARRLEFRETLQVVNLDKPESNSIQTPMDSAVMMRVGACPASLAPGQKCEVLKPTDKGSSEWPACDEAVLRPSR
jgi:hypothetical protein